MPNAPALKTSTSSDRISNFLITMNYRVFSNQKHWRLSPLVVVSLWSFGCRSQSCFALFAGHLLRFALLGLVPGRGFTAVKAPATHHQAAIKAPGSGPRAGNAASGLSCGLSQGPSKLTVSTYATQVNNTRYPSGAQCSVRRKTAFRSSHTDIITIHGQYFRDPGTNASCFTVYLGNLHFLLQERTRAVDFLDFLDSCDCCGDFLYLH